MYVPALDLKAQYQSIREEINQKILEVLASQNFILGAQVESLEKEIASLSGARYGIGVSSGSDALIVSLMALEIGEEDTVVTTAFTFFATAGAIARVRATPIFCDIDTKTFNMDPEKLEGLLKSRTKESKKSKIKAIIPVHLYGQCADMNPILAVAKKCNLFVIEDAAQAIGADYPSLSGMKKAGSMGDLGIFSFYPTKNLGGYGDGGMVLTNDEKMAQKLILLRVHGSKDKYIYEILGGNFRLDALQAAVLRVKLRHLEDWQKKRKDKAKYYDKKFEESGLVAEGSVKIPEPVYINSGVPHYHTYHQYIIRAKERDKLVEYLKGKQVGTAIYYPLPLHLQKCFSYLGYREGDFPESEKASREVLALPIYPELTEEQQNHVLFSIQEFYRK
jgi:dTDP-4-amino-4,6-dideoxygalactose transaminase